MPKKLLKVSITMTNLTHQPVMLAEALEGLAVKPDQWYLDATFGAGGHTAPILDKGGRVVALDYDQLAIEAGEDNFPTALETGKLILIRENFDQLSTVIKPLQQSGQIGDIHGVLFDFGTTSDQLTSVKRGLSFQGEDEELDMRLDQRLGVKAKDLLAVMSQEQLQKVFSEFGGERESKRVSQAIVEQRNDGQLIETVGQLVELIMNTKKHYPDRIHPATKVFQALRIAVNDELGNIERALPAALDLLESQGRLVTIAFHQGEDRLAKTFFRTWEEAGRGERINRSVIKASEEELASNPRARSAVLRIFEKNE